MPIKRSEVTLGTDPEYILLRNGQAYSSEGIIMHGKDNPKDLGKGFNVHEDNILVELNVPPAKNKSSFFNNILLGLYKIYNMYMKDRDLKFSENCYEEFDPKFLVTEQAIMGGCTPEYDALTGDIIDVPPLVAFTGRSAGGHIHIGYPNENIEDSLQIIKMLDLYLGIPSLILDKDTKRRAIYGKASSFRRTEGVKVEYRTLSNFWTLDRKLCNWVYDTCLKVVFDIDKGVVIEDDLYMRVRDIINTGNVEDAKALTKEISDMAMPKDSSMSVLDTIYNNHEFLQKMSEEHETAEYIDTYRPEKDPISDPNLGDNSIHTSESFRGIPDRDWNATRRNPGTLTGSGGRTNSYRIFSSNDGGIITATPVTGSEVTQQIINEIQETQMEIRRQLGRTEQIEERDELVQEQQTEQINQDVPGVMGESFDVTFNDRPQENEDDIEFWDRVPEPERVDVEVSAESLGAEQSAN